MAILRKGRKRGTHSRTLEKINIIIRLRLANPAMTLTDIAKLVGLSPVRMSIVMKSPEYNRLSNHYLTGIYHGLDQQVKSQLHGAGETLKLAVPVAMSELLKEVLHAKDERVRNKAANDILDRDGHFAKVSRVGVSVETDPSAINKKDQEMAGVFLKAIASSGAGETVPLTTLTPTSPVATPIKQ
jgi:hypothetical protein